MSRRVRFLMVGGFLGAGKTTAIAWLAKRLVDRGLRVGLVTNDQGHDLVDTRALRSRGFRVGEVAGACFCCRFDGLLGVLDDLGREHAPDVVITEPVGSCTDLVATVIEPLRRQHGDAYAVGPLAVLLKPEHARRLLRGGADAAHWAGFAYLFLKQIEEADVVALNKIDKLSEAERRELIGLVEEQFPGKTVLAISALRGDGLAELGEHLLGPAPEHREPIDVDYDAYAAAEAALGWLNGRFELDVPAGGLPLDALLVDLVTRLRTAFEAAGAEAAHLKVLGASPAGVAICNLVATGAAAELSRPSGALVRSAELVVNARIAAPPETLRSIVGETIAGVAAARGIRVEARDVRCFRPARPVPTHRLGPGDPDP